MPGWASLWLLLALSTLSLLRQAKINWAESEVGGCSLHVSPMFHRFCQWEAIAWGFTSHMCSLHTGSGIGASCWFHQSHLLPMLLLSLRHRGCLYDITGALFCSPGTLCGWILVSPPSECCFYRPFFCMFLSKWHFANLVDTTIASFTPLLSWLKGAPPGINPSSRQQKKTCVVKSDAWAIWAKPCLQHLIVFPFFDNLRIVDQWPSDKVDSDQSSIFVIVASERRRKEDS